MGEHSQVNGQIDNTWNKYKYFCIKFILVFFLIHTLPLEKLLTGEWLLNRSTVEKPSKSKNQGLNSDRHIYTPNRAISLDIHPEASLGCLHHSKADGDEGFVLRGLLTSFWHFTFILGLSPCHRGDFWETADKNEGLIWTWQNSFVPCFIL